MNTRIRRVSVENDLEVYYVTDDEIGPLVARLNKEGKTITSMSLTYNSNGLRYVKIIDLLK